MVSKGSGPLTASIYRSFLHVILGSVVERREHIAHSLPVDKVLGVHHRCARHKVHSGRYEPVVISDADDIGVGHIGPKHRVIESVLHRQHLLGKTLSDNTISLGGIV